MKYSRAIDVFAVPQLVRPGEVAARASLPSFLYLAGAHELPPGSLDLPWAADGFIRDGAHARAPVDALLRDALLHAGIAFAVVAGGGEQRERRRVTIDGDRTGCRRRGAADSGHLFVRDR